jgi:hypothetical protein
MLSGKTKPVTDFPTRSANITSRIESNWFDNRLFMRKRTSAQNKAWPQAIDDITKTAYIGRIQGKKLNIPDEQLLIRESLKEI